MPSESELHLTLYNNKELKRLLQARMRKLRLNFHSVAAQLNISQDKLSHFINFHTTAFVYGYGNLPYKEIMRVSTALGVSIISTNISTRKHIVIIAQPMSECTLQAQTKFLILNKPADARKSTRQARTPVRAR